YLKAVSAPYVGLQFIPTGGISLSNIGSYLAFKPIVACGGSWMVAQDWIRAKDFARIQQEVASAVQAVGETSR
ncbi:MAG: aldolase, partial [Gemmatimonadetes bacterium]|nr:aldolase [Gemmatimonadota bacterium]